jgi:hypothetical protein
MLWKPVPPGKTALSKRRSRARADLEKQLIARVVAQALFSLRVVIGVTDNRFQHHVFGPLADAHLNSSKQSA